MDSQDIRREVEYYARKWSTPAAGDYFSGYDEGVALADEYIATMSRLPRDMPGFMSKSIVELIAASNNTDANQGRVAGYFNTIDKHIMLASL